MVSETVQSGGIQSGDLFNPVVTNVAMTNENPLGVVACNQSWPTRCNGMDLRPLQLYKVIGLRPISNSNITTHRSAFSRNQPNQPFISSSCIIQKLPNSLGQQTSSINSSSPTVGSNIRRLPERIYQEKRAKGLWTIYGTRKNRGRVIQVGFTTFM